MSRKIPKELRDLEKRARSLESRVRAELKAEAQDLCQSELSLGGWLVHRQGLLRTLASLLIQQGRFEDARTAALEQDATRQEYEAWKREHEPLEPADGSTIELRDAWLLGRLDELAEALGHGAFYEKSLLARALCGRRDGVERWLRERAAWERERRRLAWQKGAGEAAKVGAAVLVDSSIAADWFWLGSFARAGAHAEMACRGFRAPQQDRPRWFAWEGERGIAFNEAAGLALLVQGRDDPDCLGPGAAHLAKAWWFAAKNSFPWDEIFFLFLIAKAWAANGDAWTEDLLRAFPWLEPICSWERHWID